MKRQPFKAEEAEKGQPCNCGSALEDVVHGCTPSLTNEPITRAAPLWSECTGWGFTNETNMVKASYKHFGLTTHRFREIKLSISQHFLKTRFWIEGGGK